MTFTGAVFHTSKYLDEADLIAQSNLCHFCGSQKLETLSGVLQEKPDIFLLRCCSCNAVSASRLPTDTALEKYYRQYYAKNTLLSEHKVTVDDPRRFGRHFARYISKYIKNSTITILDFGGGDGSICVEAAERLLKSNATKSVFITVIDYEHNLVKPKNQNIHVEYRSDLEQLKGHYDVVIASAIVEHIPYPSPILKKILSCVKGGGIFYARTPNMVPLRYWLSCVGLKLDFTYPGHIHDLGQDFWETYFSKNNNHSDFKILSSRPSLVETNFSKNFIRTSLAYLLKSPWYLLGRSYKLVGGWEVLVQRVKKDS